MYFVRLGFFGTFDEAQAMRDRLVDRYPLAWATEVTAAERERAVPAKAPPAPPARPAPAPKPAPRGDIAYVVNLASSLDPALPVRALPGPYDGYRLYRTQTRQNGKVWHRLRLGFFRTKGEAEKARQTLKALYPGAWIDIADAREQAESEQRLVRPAAAPPSRPAEPAAGDEVAKLMAQGRAALTDGRPVDAIRAFTRVLALPGAARAPEALELLGLARERNGQADLARVEYKLYLKLYPEGEGADRVRQRLANLEPAAPAKLREARRREDERRTEVFGTISQQYYRGNTKIDTTSKTGPTIGEQDTLSLTDQNALVSILDLNARYRNGRYDNRFVVSMDHVHDTLNDEDKGRVRSAYGEIRNRDAGYSARLGRQPGTSGGVLTRFDGGLFSYSLTPKLGVNLVAGTPVDEIAKASDRSFYGVSTDIGGPTLSSNLYYFHQQVDGVTDREAVGTELRYFKDNGSVFALIDYEVSYKELNIFLLQGHWQSSKGTTYNLLFDYRRSPPLQTTNALIGEPFDSIDDLLATRTEEQVRTDARDRTVEAKVFAVGVLHPFTPKLQLGFDLTLTNISGLPASGSMPATEGTGNVITYAGKAIASGLLFTNDVTVAGVAYTTGDAFDASSLALTHRVPFSRWRIDTGLRFYRQDNANGTEVERITPTLKVDYLVRRELALELEVGQERTSTSGLMQDEESTRDYFILGYRWDF